MRNAILQNRYQLLLIILLATILGTVACETTTAITVDQSNPTTFSISGGSALYSFTIYKTDKNMNLIQWQIVPKSEAARIKSVTYGIVPPGFVQKHPVTAVTPLTPGEYSAYALTQNLIGTSKLFYLTKAQTNLCQTASVVSSTFEIYRYDNLMSAAATNCIDEINHILSAGSAINKQDKNGQTALMIATANNNIEAANLLVQHGADINIKDNWGWTCLMTASANGNSKLVELLYKAGAKLDDISLDNENAFLIAVKFNRSDIARLLLSLSNTIKVEDANLALVYSAGNGDADLAKQLIERGANVNIKIESTNTPLMAAVSNGHAETAQLLLDQGAQIDVREDSYKSTILMAAAEHISDLNTINAIAKQVKNINEKDINGRTALFYAVSGTNLKAIKVLLAQGVNINAQDNGGQTALMIAVHYGNPDVVQSLLENNANPNIKDYQGDTILRIAKISPFKKQAVIDLLINAGAKE